MFNTQEKLAGSQIENTYQKDGSQIFYWNKPNGGKMRYLIGGFLIFWICGWVTGLCTAIFALIKAEPNTDTGFLVIWLIGWCIGGLIVLNILFKIFRKNLPESITLYSDCLTYDTGSIPIIPQMIGFNRSINRFNSLKELFKKRQVFEKIPKNEIQFIIEKNPSRVYFDRGIERIVIGECLTEPEKEWLYSILSNWNR